MDYKVNELVWYFGPNLKHGAYYYRRPIERRRLMARHEIWLTRKTFDQYNKTWEADECNIRRLTTAEKVLYGSTEKG